jgi:hypothetical protein
VVGELDLHGSVVEEFGGSFALDFVSFFASGPMEADRVAGIFDFETASRAPKAISPPCAVIVGLAGPQRSR